MSYLAVPWRSMLYEEASLSCSVLLFSYFISHMTLIVGACVDLDCTYWRFLPLLVLSDVFVTSYLEPFPFASIYLSSNLEVSSYTGQSQVQKCQGKFQRKNTRLWERRWNVTIWMIYFWSWVRHLVSFPV